MRISPISLSRELVPAIAFLEREGIQLQHLLNVLAGCMPMLDLKTIDNTLMLERRAAVSLTKLSKLMTASSLVGGPAR